MHFVPFNEIFVLQPGTFILGVTLEWMRLPGNLAGYVTACSSLGHRGLVIAAAAGIHPGFSGYLTLVLNNVGQVPIALRPGFSICHLFLHTAEGQTV